MTRGTRRAAIAAIGATMTGAGTAIAIAAQTTPAPTDTTGLYVLTALIFNGLTSLGSTAFLVKKYFGTVDDLARIQPLQTAALEAMAKATEAQGKSIQELYNSRNEHQTELTEIKALHDILGCADRLKREIARLQDAAAKGKNP